MSEMINLLSDTVTRPTEGMLKAMMQAEVGDDVFREDPTVNALESKVAALFGMEAALYCPSGTMTNQIAIKVHTQPLDEVICHELSHVHQSEGGSYAYHSGVSMTLLQGPQGKITAEQIQQSIKPEYDWTSRSKLVVLENTCNFGGGAVYTTEAVRPIRKMCKKYNLKLHLDGARLFNAIVENEDTPSDWGALCDTISICLSKGLGAPVGSLLVGDAASIKFARRLRKIMGGGMRQAGYIAAAGIYALDHHIERLRDDHRRARQLGEAVAALPFVENVRPVETNILIFDVKAPMSASSFLNRLEQNNIKAVGFGPRTIRFTTHLDFTEDMLNFVLQILKQWPQNL